MKYKILGNSDMNISRIGLGAWAIGGPWEWGWGEQDDRESEKTIRYALESGINWIDTAPVYGLGHSEEVVGKVIRSMSEKPLVFTKCSLVWDDQRKVSGVLKGGSIRKEVEESLSRLQVDTIDLYQIHWPNPDEDLEEAWETLAKLKEEGKVRWIGLSNFSVSQMERMKRIAPITSLQPPYNLIKREIENDILPFCQKEEIGTIVYSPMASGLLTGKMTRERISGFESTDWRRNSDDYKEPNLTENLKIADRLIEVGKRHGTTAAQIAIAWTLHNSAVTAAITGMRNTGQVDGVIGASDIQLSIEDLAFIENK